MYHGALPMRKAISTFVWAAVGTVAFAFLALSHGRIVFETYAASQRTDATDGALPKFDSPRLSDLAREMAKVGDKKGLLDKLLEEVRGKTPLVERIPGQDHERLVTFLWHGNKNTRRVGTIGTNPNPDPAEQELKRFLDTDLWYKTERMPSNARFGYLLGENGQSYNSDPFNPKVFAGRSVCELPDAPKELWINKLPTVPAGTLSEHKITSRILNEERSVSVYLPATYNDKAEPYTLLVVFDGESYGSSPESAIQTPTILDNLAAAKKTPPVVAILVNSQRTRDRDLVCSDRFSDFLAKELIPWCRHKYRVSTDPSRAIVAGSSYGGLCATFTAFKHSDIFGNVLSQSGTFTYFPNWQQMKITDYRDDLGWLTRQLATHTKLPIRFYLSVGWFEAGSYWNLLRENRRLRDVLQARGYGVTYAEYSGGHDYVGWRSTLGEGLIALTRLNTRDQR